MEKAAQSLADQVFLDLEDSVAPARKAEARALVVDALNNNDFGTKLKVVRVNDASEGLQFRDIIELVCGAGQRIDALMIPKVESAAQIACVEGLLEQLETELALSHTIGLEVQIETAKGSYRLAEIASASDRIESIVFGPGDYAVSLGISQLVVGAVDSLYSGHQWHHVLSQIATAARAVGAQAIDGPYGDFGDHVGYRQQCVDARQLGFDGKWCIHPSQIETANEVFQPSETEVSYAETLLRAYVEARQNGRGAATFDGRMIDEVSRKMAESVLERAQLISDHTTARNSIDSELS